MLICENLANISQKHFKFYTFFTHFLLYKTIILINIDLDTSISTMDIYIVHCWHVLFPSMLHVSILKVVFDLVNLT